MIARKQYFRLTVLLLAPLLLLGLWLAEEGNLPINQVIYCNAEAANPYCYSINTSKKGQRSSFLPDGRVAIGGSAGGILENGFMYRVKGVEHPTHSSASSHGSFSTIDGKNSLFLKLPRKTTGTYMANSCVIHLSPERDGSWLYQCDDGDTGRFFFAQREVDEKFLKLHNDVAHLKELRESRHKMLAIMVLLLPLACYFLLSLAYLCLRRLARFVINGKKNRPEETI